MKVNKHANEQNIIWNFPLDGIKRNLYLIIFNDFFMSSKIPSIYTLSLVTSVIYLTVLSSIQYDQTRSWLKHFVFAPLLYLHNLICTHTSFCYLQMKVTSKRKYYLNAAKNILGLTQSNMILYKKKSLLLFYWMWGRGYWI
jgi:hypothetical protein